MVLIDSFVVRKPDEFAGWLISFIVLLILFSSVSALNLTQGQCVTDVNSSIQYCAPPNLAGQTVQLAYPSFGVTEKLNHSCASGEFVRGAQAPFQNQNALLQPNSTNLTFVPYFNFTMSCTAGNVTVLNGTIYVNNTIVQKPRLDTDQVLGFGDKYWNYDMNLSISCPEFPKINDIWQLAPAEKKRVEDYNLIVSCANSSEMCPICSNSLINNNCSNSTIIEPITMQACINAGFTPLPTPTPKNDWPIPSDYNWLIILVVLVGAGFLLNQYLKSQPKKEEVK